MIKAVGYFFSEAAASLWRGRRANLLSVLTIAIGLFVLGVFLVLTSNVQQLVSRWTAAAEFSVYLDDGASEQQKEAVRRAARLNEAVARVEYVSKPDALRRFTRDFPELAAAARHSPANPFPASFEVRLAAGGTSGAERLAQSLRGMPGVSEVRYDRRWLDRLSSFAAAMRWTGVALSAVLILAAALTIATVVRLALFARRDEVEIMELVGAPMTFIRGPFVCEGILQGALGAVIALAGVRVAFGIARPALDTVAQVGGGDGARFLSLSAILLLLAGGALVGCMGSLFAVRRVRA